MKTWGLFIWEAQRLIFGREPTRIPRVFNFSFGDTTRNLAGTARGARSGFAASEPSTDLVLINFSPAIAVESRRWA